jgi:transposase
MRNLLALLWNEWKDLEQQLVDLNQEVERIASSDAACTRLRQIPGIGPLVATAIVLGVEFDVAIRRWQQQTGQQAVTLSQTKSSMNSLRNRM